MTSESTASLLGNLRLAVNRDHRRRRHRRLAALAAAPLVIAAGAAIASDRVPWWQDAAPPANPRIVDRQLAPGRASFPPAADRSRARTVARSDGAALVAAPVGESGYCLIPSLPGSPDLGFSCEYQVRNADEGGGSMFRGYARPASAGAPRWIVYGRITDPAARTLDLTRAAGAPLAVPLAPGGFFLADVPESRWAALSNRSGKAEILDGSGETLRTPCIHWGVSPESELAGRSRWGSIAEGTSPPGPCPAAPIVLPEPVLERARLVLEVPAGRGTVLRLYESPSSTGGTCTFTDAAEAGSTSRPTRMGGGACSAEPGPRHRGDAPIVLSSGLTREGLAWPRSTLHGTVDPDLDAVRVRLEWATGARELAFADGYFLAANPYYDPPDENLPYEVVAYGADGREVARMRIPKAWLSID